MKKIQIEVTEEQLNILKFAVELAMRTGMGQEWDLSDWLVSNGGKPIREEGFDSYIQARSYTSEILRGMMSYLFRAFAEKSDRVLELQTLYDVLKHEQWLLNPNHDHEFVNCNIDSRYPMQWGNEPFPRIKEIDDESEDAGVEGHESCPGAR